MPAPVAPLPATAVGAKGIVLARTTLASVGLVLAVFLVYGKTAGFGFLGSEDQGHVSDFYAVSKAGPLDGWKILLSTVRFGQWIPVALISHKLDCLLFGLDAGWHHVVNLLIHSACCILFMLFARKLGVGWTAAFLASLLMAVHPQHVQLVAWIAERKDLLAYLFAMLALFGYVHWVEGGKRWVYGLTLLCFALGLTSRFLIAGLPLIFLALDTWPLRRAISLERRLNEKLPFFILGAVVVFFTFSMQAPQTARFGVDTVPLWHRGLAICGNGVLYLWNTVFCKDLSFYNGYPFGLTLLIGAGAVVLLALVSAVVWRMRRRFPFLGLGWVWYLAALLPVCGVCILGPNFHSDHYSYLPHMGVCLILAFFYDKLPTFQWRGLFGAAALAVAVALAMISTRQVESYSSMGAVLEREKEVAWDRPGNLFTIASQHHFDGEFAQAERCWERVVALGDSPSLAKAHEELSKRHFARGDLRAVLESLEGAIASSRLPVPELEENRRRVAEVVAQGIFHR